MWNLFFCFQCVWLTLPPSTPPMFPKSARIFLGLSDILDSCSLPPGYSSLRVDFVCKRYVLFIQGLCGRLISCLIENKNRQTDGCHYCCIAVLKEKWWMCSLVCPRSLYLPATGKPTAVCQEPILTSFTSAYCLHYVYEVRAVGFADVQHTQKYLLLL